MSYIVTCACHDGPHEKDSQCSCEWCKPERWSKPERLLKPDLVNHPKHYISHPSGVEAIDICELLGFNLGNAIKYLFRYDWKGTPKQDLENARWYLQRTIDRNERYRESHKLKFLIEKIHETIPGTILSDVLLRVQENWFYAAINLINDKLEKL